jgi:predicted nucleic acid-binding protein
LVGTESCPSDSRCVEGQRKTQPGGRPVALASTGLHAAWAKLVTQGLGPTPLTVSVRGETLHMLRIVGITPTLIRDSIQLVFKHHIYVADALQITSAKTINSSKFLTGDKKLAKIAEQEGLQATYIG